MPSQNACGSRPAKAELIIISKLPCFLIFLIAVDFININFLVSETANTKSVIFFVGINEKYVKFGILNIMGD